jgi:hypothetical protein
MFTAIWEKSFNKKKTPFFVCMKLLILIALIFFLATGAVLMILIQQHTLVDQHFMLSIRYTATDTDDVPTLTNFVHGFCCDHCGRSK